MSDAATDLTAPAPRPFDADNHYYEALDAFSRRIVGWAPRGLQAAPAARTG